MARDFCLAVISDGSDGCIIIDRLPLVEVLPWAVHLPEDDQRGMLEELAGHPGATDEIHGILHAWKRTAEILADPEMRDVLLNETFSEEDFVDAPRPEEIVEEAEIGFAEGWRKLTAQRDDARALALELKEVLRDLADEWRDDDPRFEDKLPDWFTGDDEGREFWEGHEPSYLEKVSAPLSERAIVALNGELASGNYARYKHRPLSTEVAGPSPLGIPDEVREYVKGNLEGYEGTGDAEPLLQALKDDDAGALNEAVSGLGNPEFTQGLGATWARAALNFLPAPPEQAYSNDTANEDDYEPNEHLRSAAAHRRELIRQGLLRFVDADMDRDQSELTTSIRELRGQVDKALAILESSKHAEQSRMDVESARRLLVGNGYTVAFGMPEATPEMLEARKKLVDRVEEIRKFGGSSREEIAAIAEVCRDFGAEDPEEGPRSIRALYDLFRDRILNL